MSRALSALLVRDLKLAYRRRGEVLTPAMFFILVTILFPLGLSPQPELLRSIAPGVLWTAALLAGLIGQESLLVLSLLLGTSILSLLGAVGAALTVGLRQSGMLLPILVLPLAVPVLIFGAQAAAQAAHGEDPAGALYLLAALLALGLTLIPFAIAAAVRVSLES